MELHDRMGAIRAFEALLAVNARNAAAWFNLGFIHDHNETNAEAERCFRAAVEIDPLLDRAWYGLGLVLIRQRRLAEAVVALKRNTKLQPFSPYGWYQLAMTHHHLGQSADALRIHEEMLRFEPHFAATLKRDLDQTQSQSALESTPGPVSADGSMKEAITTP
jgi:tetratricopeptide (TPR) repeat protein